MEASAIRFAGVSKSFTAGGRSHRALKRVTFSVAAGETLALVGTSGAGKSTVGRLLLGLVRPDRGAIGFYGHALELWLRSSQRRSFRQRCQAIFQDARASLSPRLTVGQLLREALVVGGGRSRAESDGRAAEALSRVGLDSGLLQRKPYQLSGGEAQRVCLARALLRHPQVLVCDEPTSGLDMVTESEIVALLDHLKRQHRLTMLFMTHNLDIVRRMADRVAVLSAGEIVEQGSVTDVLQHPQHPLTQRLVSDTKELTPRYSR